MQKKCEKTREKKKKVGARCSDSQKSYKHEYDRTQSSRAVSAGY